jgi:hypothetical protein
VRIAVKDQANECTWFGPRVTVARDTSSAGSNAPPQNVAPPISPTDARAAFDNLFKKE